MNNPVGYISKNKEKYYERYALFETDKGSFYGFL